ncbi:adenosylcobalamin-dependent ribonucleoside-diphosphate reductase [Thermomicrobium sp. 4228-Ro]|uniref:adenosylcobalamin-dependent ribonucleoside-diphosphate reductase n=1 Tax=Thermomicrobium sp. 4228-Ro TaxID=2993937 RepID=UPI002249380E|nr:adenosylcobalamin-dependent ribonucleoside-diphosphate reductase [Thermomicrobium sp. 4228-Ro]MCX2725931.1 adenosylcobalamin-dependent ribonucleoside-diphosphate reductase [Thermomicrobium sp. 4228-Ro]
MTVPLTESARALLRMRYLRRDDQGRVIESEEELFWRVARAVAAAEDAFANGRRSEEVAEEFYRLLTSLRFLPNTPALINAGTELGQLFACFVLPVPDSLDGIFGAVRDAAKIQQTGGGTGFSFSHLRPRGDLVRSTRRPSSGAVSFIRVFDTASDVIATESVRGGANMAVLRCDHPDVREFINAKRNPALFSRFNFSVLVTDTFLEAARARKEIDLINPRTGAPFSRVNAGDLFDEMVDAAWEVGDPGLLFFDRIQRDNPLPALGPLEATNPCGEVPLLPWEACVLGSLNLKAFVVEQEGGVYLDEDELRRAARLALRFLDNMVEVSRYPKREIEAICRANRKVGLGIMGFADLLLFLRIPYGSDESIAVADRVMRIVQEAAVEASREIAQERGPFPNFPLSRYAERGEPPRRNATVTTVAPTGSISIIAGCSSGIEPLYALAYQHVGEFVGIVEPHPLLLRELSRLGIHDPSLLREIELTGRIGHRTDLPEELRRLFRVATEISPEEHIRVQAAIQRHVENAVSKTINMPYEATRDDVRRAFLLAHELACKGVTVYREGSPRGQVLQVLGHCLSCMGEDVVPEARARY